MKATWLIPRTMNMEPVVNSLKGFDQDIRFLGEGDLKLDLITSDLIVYIGAVAGPYWIDIEGLKKIKGLGIPFMKICCDADCIDWHPLLERYAKENIFDLVVNLNGNKKWPSRPKDLTLLSPIDPEPYKYELEKDLWLGFCGGIDPGKERDLLLKELGSDVVIGQRIESYGHHDQYVNFLKRCRCTLNIPYSSSGKSTRVNGRIIEAALAGNVLIERKDSEAANWFIPGFHYLEYESADDIKKHIKTLKEDPYLIGMYAGHLQECVKNNYSATHFWSRVFKQLNLGAGLHADC